MGVRESAEAALDCLGVQGGDVVAVVFNDEQRSIAEALALAANRRARQNPHNDRHKQQIASQTFKSGSIR